MHVLLVNYGYPPDTGHGGIAAYQQQLAHALVRLGHRVTVICANPAGKGRAEKDGEITVYRMPVRQFISVARCPRLGMIVRPLEKWNYSRSVAAKIAELETNGSPDIIEFAEVEAEAFVYLRGPRKKPAVVRCHTPTFLLAQSYTQAEMRYAAPFMTMMESFCIRRADSVSAPSADLARIIQEKFSTPVKVIPNGLDVERYAAIKAQRGERREHGPLNVLFVGRMDRCKGIQILAEAILILAKAHPEVRFVYFGSDQRDGEGRSWRQRLGNYFSSAGISDKVIFPELVGEEALVEWYRRADIVVVPSLIYESFSYTCAQAMLAGIPVVASGVGGIPETVGDAGILVPPGNAEKLAGGLAGLIRNPDLRQEMAESGHRGIRSRFDASATALSTLEFYKQTVETFRRLV